jgi:hypothetical protein
MGQQALSNGEVINAGAVASGSLEELCKTKRTGLKEK